MIKYLLVDAGTIFKSLQAGLIAYGALGLFLIALLDAALIPIPGGPDVVVITLSHHSHLLTPLYVVVGRGGPNLIRGMGALQDTVESLGLPYRMFGFDSAISEVVNYAQAADRWMKAGGREQLAQRLGMRKAA